MGTQVDSCFKIAMGTQVDSSSKIAMGALVVVLLTATIINLKVMKADA